MVPGMAVRGMLEHRCKNEKAALRVGRRESSSRRRRTASPDLGTVIQDTATIRCPLPRRGCAGPAKDCHILRSLAGRAHVNQVNGTKLVRLKAPIISVPVSPPPVRGIKQNRGGTQGLGDAVTMSGAHGGNFFHQPAELPASPCNLAYTATHHEP